MTRPLPGDPVVLPSLMSADMLHLGDQLDELLDAGARVFHVDVMDAHFVPNLTLGPDFARAVAGPIHEAGGLVDVHLMVASPGGVIPLFAPHADAITVHVEADPHPHRLLGAIREGGCAAGLAINPGTPLDHVTELADELDYVNVMAISPGFAGQKFRPATPDRIARLRARLPGRVRIEVDGGIGAETLPPARDAGATLLVSASTIFGSADPIATYRELAALAAAG
ncbi:MAG: ribulose-phosphate 3-epimerase [Thermoleophilia bacterium]